MPVQVLSELQARRILGSHVGHDKLSETIRLGYDAVGVVEHIRYERKVGALCDVGARIGLCRGDISNALDIPLCSWSHRMETGPVLICGIGWLTFDKGKLRRWTPFVLRRADGPDFRRIVENLRVMDAPGDVLSAEYPFVWVRAFGATGYVFDLEIRRREVVFRRASVPSRAFGCAPEGKTWRNAPSLAPRRERDLSAG